MHGGPRLRDRPLCAPLCVGGQSSLHVLRLSALAVALELEEAFTRAYLYVGSVGPFSRVAIDGKGVGI